MIYWVTIDSRFNWFSFQISSSRLRTDDIPMKQADIHCRQMFSCLGLSIWYHALGLTQFAWQNTQVQVTRDAQCNIVWCFLSECHAYVSILNLTGPVFSCLLFLLFILGDGTKLSMYQFIRWCSRDDRLNCIVIFIIKQRVN